MRTFDPRMARPALIRRMLAGALAPVTVTVSFALLLVSFGGHANAAPVVQKEDRFRVVDCLLPGEVRKLGAAMVFQSPRRPVKAAIDECEARGGEYTLFQAGSAAAALSYWLPLAQQGDVGAQVTVGEMFEKGVGQTPDYTSAALWYRRAADQGFARAQINLGHLYEKGLGVPKDPVTALNLYRRAAKIEGAIVLDDGTIGSRDEESARLRKELEETRQQLEKARRDLQQQRSRSEADIERLKRQQTSASNQGNTAEAKRLEEQVRQLESQLLTQKRTVAMLQQSERRYDEQIRALESEAGQLRQQVAAAATLDEELARMRNELAATRRDLDRSKREVDAMRASSASEIARLTKQQAEAAKQGRAEDARRLEDQVKQLQAQVGQRERQLAALEQSAERYREQIRSLETETDQLRRQVADLEGQIGALNGRVQAASRELSERQRAAAADEKRIVELRDQLARQKQQAASAGRVAEIEKALRQREEEKGRQAKEIDRLERQVKQFRDQIAGLEAERNRASAAAAPPRIDLIDPQIAAQATRGPVQVKVRGGLATREIVGKVVAPAGLFSFKVNDLAEALDNGGLFKVEVPLNRTVTPVNIVAIDRLGRHSTVDLLLVPDSAQAQAESSSGVAPPHALLKTKISPAEFGRYHALVIGNNNYKRLEKLDTAVNDAKALAKVLEDKYGFQVTLLVDADRYTILRSLYELRRKLTSRDNLLIFYAGHGILDPEKRQGFWQPVDAEPDNDANWIEHGRITSDISVMEAKHILVIADSCYSGLLTRSSLIQPTISDDEKRATYLKSYAKAKVRVVMTSGGDAPVLDGGGDGKHSVFTRNLLDVLSQAQDVIEAGKVADAVKERVIVQAAVLRHIQRPLYQPLALAGHEGGDFVFLPTR